MFFLAFGKILGKEKIVIFQFLVVLVYFFLFFFISFLGCVRLGHRQISPSLSSLHDRTLFPRPVRHIYVTFNETVKDVALPVTRPMRT